MRKNILVTPLMAVLATGALYSQEIDGTITGRVTGPDGNPLQGVRVSITSPSLLSARTARTDANGSFRVPLLPPGQYSLTYVLDGYMTRRVSATLIAGTTINASAKLQGITAQSASVEITTSTTGTDLIQIDKTDTTVQTSFTAQRMNEIVGSSITSITALTPGVQGTFGNGAANMSIRGGLVRGVKMLQDGQQVNDALLGTIFNEGLVVEDAIESVAIVTSPQNAKYGNTDSGMVVVTSKKGSNTFSGSLRATPSRQGGLWASMPARYPNRNGVPQAAVANPSGGDGMTRNWEFTLRGPIIPGYLTFAYGGTLRPPTYNLYTFASNGSGSALTLVNEWTSTKENYRKRLGTFYETSDGFIITKPEYYAVNGPDAPFFGGTESQGNSFNLYLELFQNHNLSYYYQQTSTFSITNGSFNSLESTDEYGQDQMTRNWNINYRGIIGSAGVLTAAYGKATSARAFPKAGKDAVQNRFWATLYPFDNNFSNMDPENYYGRGIIDLTWAKWEPVASGDLTSVAGLSHGLDSSGDQVSTTTTIRLDYSHMLDFNGSHSIDVGINRIEAMAPAIPSGAVNLYDPVGRISLSLLNADVRHPNGSIGNAELYRGMYIVFDPRISTINDLEPQAARANYQGTMLYGNELLWMRDPGQEFGYINPKFNTTFRDAFLPRLTQRFTANPGATGAVYTNSTAYYINDMWTINNNHSLMLGLRADQYDVGGEFNTLINYIKLSPRVVYTYDLFGDQKHLFKLSYIHIHQAPPLSLYWPFIDTKFGGTSTKMWSPSEGSPFYGKKGYYLVSETDMMNPANYTEYVTAPNLSGTMDNRLEKGFKPPTAIEYSLLYVRNFTNGGSWRVTFTLKDWYDLYDFFPDGYYQYGASRRIRTVLKNTDMFKRTYSGVELQWDTPITSKIVFGGHYTFSRTMSNMSSAAASTSFANAEANVALQTPDYFDARFQELLDRQGGFGIGGYTWASGRDMWAPMMNTGTNEFYLSAYLNFNFTQGRVRSALTLNADYTGNRMTYDTMRVRVGYPIIDGINTNNADSLPSGTAATFGSGYDVRLNEYTMANSMNVGSLRYTMTMPIVRKLSWTVSGTVSNFFNHQPKAYSAPGSAYVLGTSVTVGTTSQMAYTGATGAANIYTPFVLSGSNAGTAPNGPSTTLNQFIYRYGAVFDGNISSYYVRDQRRERSITLSTGLTF